MGDQADRRTEELTLQAVLDQLVFDIGPDLGHVGHFLPVDDEQNVEVGVIAPDHVVDEIPAGIGPVEDDHQQPASA